MDRIRWNAGCGVGETNETGDAKVTAGEEDVET